MIISKIIWSRFLEPMFLIKFFNLNMFFFKILIIKRRFNCKYFKVIDQMQVEVWRKCYGLSHRLLSSILQSVDLYFQYIFGKGWFFMLLQCSSHNHWVFLDNVWTWYWPQTSKGIGWSSITWLHQWLSCIDTQRLFLFIFWVKQGG
jgi:hypothetical protein